MSYDSTVMVAEDFSAVGRLSLTTAISIFSGFGIQTAAIPTEVLSTQTEEFGRPESQKSDDWIQRALTHWKYIDDLTLNSALVGFVGSTQTCELLRDYIKRGTFDQVVIDPVMGDRGKMYDGFNDNYLASMKRLLEVATVMTPNATELELLTGFHLDEASTDRDILTAIRACSAAYEKRPRVVVTGIVRDAGIGSCFEKNGRLIWSNSPLIEKHFYGTGDLFAALLCGYLTYDVEFETAVQRATFGTYEAVARTGQLPLSRRKYGLDLTKTLNDVTKFTLGLKRGEM